ncbi:MAG: helix-turn-helix domain-containing protein [Nitrosopumilaceae archaeon]|nr:winged helix-turn-helix transcriptional regulator [Nitrosopumilaceae archaeon]NIU02509.1 winged helix-turn-helix transcriptional regulator [Nitrosopumilaceae archaeon]NIU88970.1 helix-turn-helix domain-containing protein [Nitrosopumilaceae archaeon]NIV67081.1 helix-turn-helix domain-containing protein [Nitrosopumilaceae archaeon]NIX63110.1 helix-turn-helix domain-containing protein [Nitrosopumilaceae archaeon]
MSTILEKPIKVNRIVTTNVGQARALEDPARAKVIELLYRRAMTADQIAKELKKNGHKKALTTIRHHLEILKEAGLISIVKMEETRGAITKYYSTNIRLLGYEIPDDFETRYSKQIETTSNKIEKILKNLTPKALPKSKKKRSGVDSENYSKYVLVEIVNRALTSVLEEESAGSRYGHNGELGKNPH